MKRAISMLRLRDLVCLVVGCRAPKSTQTYLNLCARCGGLSLVTVKRSAK